MAMPSAACNCLPWHYLSRTKSQGSGESRCQLLPPMIWLRPPTISEAEEDALSEVEDRLWGLFYAMLAWEDPEERACIGAGCLAVEEERYLQNFTWTEFFEGEFRREALEAIGSDRLGATHWYVTFMEWLSSLKVNAALNVALWAWPSPASSWRGTTLLSSKLMWQPPAPWRRRVLGALKRALLRPQSREEEKWKENGSELPVP